MRSTVLNVVTSILAFIAGVTAVLSWQSSPTKKPEPPRVNAQSSPVPTPPAPASTAAPLAPEPIHEAVFAKGRLRLVPENIQLASDRLRYEINVTYPQIAGSDEPYIQKLNQRFKQLATETYQWQLYPSKADLRRWKSMPEPLNLTDLTYDVTLANDSLLSIFFFGSSYGIGAAHGVQFSFTVNYDLTNRRELQLSDIFKPQKKYIAFLTAYCKDDLTKALGSIFDDRPKPEAESFKSWYFTHEGISINFDSCSVTGCSGGSHVVDISYDTLKPWLRDRFRPQRTALRKGR